MAKKDDEDPVVLEEPEYEGDDDEVEDVWLRGLWMVLFIVLLWVARGILIVAAVIQFFWMLFKSERNRHIAEFGEDLADWMARATLFVSGATEDRPFPFDQWGIPD
ncbi:MAG TPA: hypothetical protein DEO85_11815 [Maritimibacter sp.]|nr:hypothetical protein [Maritimibacter sp.]